MNNIGKISVVVPIFNQELYLNQSIPSIQGQTYTNIEIILVNDGSTDASARIIDEFAKKDSRIKVVTQENGGLVSATIAGCQSAHGDYIAFLDPDDYYGENYLYNFIREADRRYDFIAEGFYYDCHGKLTPYYLKQTQVFDEESIRKLRKTYLYSTEFDGLSNTIFISRWNKIYRADVIKKLIPDFLSCKEISLGEDTLFTYLVLKYSKNGKSIGRPNSYFYNIGNQNSMMKNSAIERHINAAKLAYSKFEEILGGNSDDTLQADILYFYLVESLLDRLKKEDRNKAIKLYTDLRKDSVYKKATRVLYNNAHTTKSKLKMGLKKYCRSGHLYFYLADNGIQNLKKIKLLLQDVAFICKSCKRNGYLKTKKLYQFRIDRRNAFDDLQIKMPEIEQQINEIIAPVRDLTTDFDQCPIVDNIFIYWKDGFENAPVIVQKCVRSIEKHHPNSKIIKIDDKNFKEYTDINETIIRDFEQGLISVQTFSDILRFNLLKNHGGTWIDATIFFDTVFDLINSLEQKPIESLCFNSTRNYFQYKGVDCSWSGFFFASRKNSAFVRVMDYIFENYYLKYHTYSIYFFIDAALMVCKLNKIDDDALGKIRTNSGDMFALSHVLGFQYDEKYMTEIRKVPQKLTWNCDTSHFSKNSMYSAVIANN